MTKNIKSTVPSIRFPEFNGEWVEKKIEELLTIGSGKDYKNLKKGDIPVYGTGGYMTSVNDYLYDGESVCIGRKGTIDKPRFIDGKFWTVDTLFYTHSFKQSLPQFVFLLFQNINWKKYNEASGVPSLSKATIEKIKLFIPAISEQEKISKFISLNDKRLNLLRKKKDELTKYKNGVVQKVFSKSLRFKDQNGDEFPDWQDKELGEITSYVDYRGRAPKKSDQGIFLVTAKNIKKGFIDYDNSKEYVLEKDYNKVMSKGLPQVGDVLFTTEAPLGNVCLVDNSNIALAQRVIKLRGKDGLKNTYLLHYMLSDTYQKLINRMAFGTTVLGISGKELRKTSIKLPSLEEQTKIADFFTSIDKSIENISQQIDDSHAFKQSLLQKMFT